LPVLSQRLPPVLRQRKRCGAKSRDTGFDERLAVRLALAIDRIGHRRRVDAGADISCCGYRAMRKIFGQLVVAALCLLSLDVSVRAESGCETPDIDFKFLSGEMSPSALPFVREMPVAIRAVCEWWGPTYSGPFRIVVNNVFRESMALVPAWYGKIGYILFPDTVVYLYRGRAATVHEVTHVFAPNANRFLAEGLAVYAHEHLKGPLAYPNFGVDTKMLARKYAGNADISLFDRIGTPTPLRFSSSKLEEREIYILAGSFVRYLISEFGFSKFRELYALTPLVPGARNAGDANRWEEVYGLAINQLASKWRASLDVE
jgi:hypothetical protein